jgi:hypothetical protein
MNKLKSAHPAPPPLRQKKRIELIDWPWFCTAYIAEIIVFQYPDLSRRSQQRLVQKSIQELKLHNFAKFPIKGYCEQDLIPRLPYGTPEYSRKATQLILENMCYEVKLLP